MRRIATPIVLAALLAAGCGGDDSAEPRVAIEVDASAEGDPQLLGGPAGDTQQQRVAITPDGVPTALYAVRMSDLENGVGLRALSTVTVTKCQHTDYDPQQRAHTGCQYTKRYDYNPVAVKTAFRVLPDDGGKPDLSATGVGLGSGEKVECTNLKHHCTLINIAETEVGESASDDDLEWVVLQAEATNPKASSCEPRRPRDCEVLAVEVQKGTVMYVIDARGEIPAPPSLPRDRTEDRKSLPVINDETEGNPRQGGRAVVYSVPLSSKHGIKGLLGAQFEVGALLRVASESNRYAPLVTSYIVLSDSPGGVSGRYLVSNSYSPARTGNTGENCGGTCTYVRGAAATVILPCDVRAGRRFVNLVAGAARDDAPSGQRLRVQDGRMRVVRFYDNRVSANSRGHC